MDQSLFGFLAMVRGSGGVAFHGGDGGGGGGGGEVGRVLIGWMIMYMVPHAVVVEVLGRTLGGGTGMARGVFADGELGWWGD